jgi:CHASE2 domain-containing sensor protein
VPGARTQSADRASAWGSSGLNIFISYRRRESSGYSGRIYDRLRALMPDADVFMDVERIDPGQDWRERLAERLRAAEVVLVSIGDEWRTLSDQSGRRRLDDPQDVTRWELESALALRKRMVPILLDDAAPLRAEELPLPLQPLAALQAVRIRHESFDAGIEDLVARLTGRRLRDEAEDARRRLRIERAKRWSIPAIALVAVLLAWTRLFDLLALDTRIATWTLALADAFWPLTLDPNLVPVGIAADVDARDPATRARYGEAIVALARAGARRIVLDIHFHEPRSTDPMLANAMREARMRGAEVFFSFVDANDGRPRAVPQLASAATGVGLACVGRRLGYVHTVAVAFGIREDAQGWQANPVPALALAGAAGDARIVTIEPRARTLTVQASGKLTRFAYSLLSNPVAGAQGCPAMTPGTRTAELMVRLAPVEALRARRIGLAELLAGSVAAERVAGKTIVMGFETPGEAFRVARGLERASVFGYELHANAINVLWGGRSPAFASPALQAVLAAILATLGAAFGVRLRRLSAGPAAAVLVAAVVLYFVAAVLVAATEDVLLMSAYDLAAFGIAYALFRYLGKRWQT